MTDAPRHTVAAESQFASAAINDATFAREFAEICHPNLSAIKAMDWLAAFCAKYARNFKQAPGADVLPYAEAAVRACEIPPEALGFYAAAAKQTPRSVQSLLARARTHYHLLARQRHADKVAAAIMSGDEEGITAADAELKGYRGGVEVYGDGESVTDPAGNAAMFESLPKPLFRLPGYVGELLNPWLTRDALVIGLAGPKIGKTATMARLAYEAACAQLRVLYLTLGDDKVPRIRRRFYTCSSGRPVGGEAEGGAVPYVCCKKGALGTCKRSCGTPLSPYPTDKVLASKMPEELIEAYPDFRPCRECWENCKATSKDFEPMIWWLIDNPEPMDIADADREGAAMNSLFRGGNIDIAYRPKGKLSIDGLNDMLDRREDKYGMADDVVAIDYPDMMALPAGDKDHERMRGVWEELRNTASERDNLTLAVTQTNRDGGANAETQTLDTIGRSKTAADNCTGMFGMNQTPLERAWGVTRIAKIVGREGKTFPEHQAMCCSWLHAQDPFAESFHVYKKIDKREERR